jgi:hypothetical protein
MPRIAWFIISYAVAVVLAVSMRSAGYDEFANLTAALVVWILPFVISKACALFITIQNPDAQPARRALHWPRSAIRRLMIVVVACLFGLALLMAFLLIVAKLGAVATSGPLQIFNTTLSGFPHWLSTPGLAVL